MKKLEKILSYGIPAALLCGFLAYAVLSQRADTVTVVCGSISILIIAFAHLRGLSPFLKYCTGPSPSPLYEKLGERSRRRLYPTLRIILLSFIAQLVFILGIYAIHNAVNGFSGTIFKKYPEIFMRSNYFGLGEYAHNAEERLALLPLIPLVSDLIGGLTGQGVLCAFLINTICICALTVMLHRVMLFDSDRRASFEALIILFLSPAMVYLLMPQSGIAPFLLFSLCVFYFLRKGKFFAAGIFCTLSVLCNVLGILLIIPIIMETVKALVLKSKGESRCTPKEVLKSVAAMLLPIVAVGLSMAAASLSLYEQSPFKLLGSSGFRFFFEDLGLLVGNWNLSATSANAMFTAIVAYIGFGAMLGLAAKRMHSPFTVFTMLWYALAPAVIGSHNMLIYSLCLCPTLPMIMADCLRRRIPRLIFMGVLLAAQIIFVSIIFVMRY